MSQSYINSIKFNNGIRPAGNFPLDDREIWNSVENFFITEAESKNPRDLIDSTESMYNKVYTGMTVKLVVSDEEREEFNLVNNVVVFTCIDDSPYKPDTCKEVNKNNFRNFWREDGRDVYDQAQDHSSHLDVVDSSINKLVTYAHATNVTEATNGALNITVTEETAGVKGKKYALSVKVDNDSVKIINDKITGCQYKLVSVTPSNDNVTASYRLACKKPGETTYTNLPDCVIDIAKDYVIKEVHYCKATVANGVYTETAKPGDSNWKTAAGDVFLHIIWHTKKEDDHKTETWINIGEMIKIDLEDINTSIGNLNSSLSSLWGYVRNSVDPSIINIKSSITELEGDINRHIDSSITMIQSTIKTLDSSLTSSINNLKTVVNQNKTSADTAISDLNTSTNSHINASVAALNTAIANLNTSANDHINASVSALDTAITNLNTSVNTHLNTVVANVNSSISDLSTRHAALISTNKSNIDKLNTSLNELKSELVADELTITNGFIDVNNKIKALDTSVSTAVDNLNTSTNNNINGVKNTITNSVNPSINDLKSYVQAINVENAGGIIVGNSATTYNCKGKKYTVKVNVDADTIKIVNDKVTAGKYRFEKLGTATNGFLASYQLAYKAPDATTYTKLTDCTIDIPKDFVVKEVHYCKAIIEGGKYKETARDTDTNWATAAGDVYLHFIWETKSDGNQTDETWLKVADFIKLDLKEINAAITKLQSDVTALDTSANTHINKVFSDLNTSISALNSSANSHINASVSALNTAISDLNTSTNSHINASVSALNTAITNLNTSANDHINASVSALDTAITNLNTSVNTHLNASAGELKTMIAVLDTSMNKHIDGSVAYLNQTITNKVDTLNTSVNTHMNASINDINRHIDSSYVALDTKITKNIGDLSTLLSSNFQAQIDANKNKIALIDSSLTELKDIVIDNELTVTNSFLDVNNRIKILDTSVKMHIDASVVEINNTIVENELVNSNAWNDLDSRLKAAIARIAALEAKVTP